jgi:hypothetical protein
MPLNIEANEIYLLVNTLQDLVQSKTQYLNPIKCSTLSNDAIFS